MSIEIHNPHVVNSLISDAHRHRVLIYPAQPSKAQCDKTTKIKRSQPIFSSHQTTTASKLKLDSQSNAQDVERDCYKQLLCNETLYRELHNTENTFVKSLEGVLNDSKQQHRNKYNILFTKWEDNVYNKLQNDIKSKLKSKQYQRLDTQKRHLFSRYLDTCNFKGTVFLDVISKGEYDPLTIANRGLSTKISTRSDPTKLNQNEELQSRSIERECGLGGGKEVKYRDSRESCNEWIRHELKDVDSHIRQRSRQRMMDKTACSVNHTGDELNLQKRKPALPSYSLHRPLSQMFY